MHVAGLLLGCLLFASASDAHRARSSDIVGEAMQLPAGSAVTGQRLTLLAAISSNVRSRSAIEDRSRLLAAGAGRGRLCLLPELREGA